MHRALLVSSFALFFVCGSALAQDRPPDQPKVRAAQPKSAPQPAVAKAQAPALRADPFATAASQAATIAEKEAICLREAAQRVHGLALRLRAATDPAQIAKQREELDFALGVVDECRNIARQREKQARAPERSQRAPVVAEPARDNPGLFSFGSIAVEEGDLDPRTVARALQRQSHKLVRCYEPNEARGAAKLRLRLSPSGKGAAPSAVAVESSSIDDPDVHRCVARTLMSTAFPARAAGSEVSMEIGFAPPGQ